MKEINRPIDHTWTDDEIRQEYEKCMDKKKLSKIFCLDARELNRILKVK